MEVRENNIGLKGWPTKMGNDFLPNPITLYPAFDTLDISNENFSFSNLQTAIKRGSHGRLGLLDRIEGDSNYRADKCFLFLFVPYLTDNKYLNYKLYLTPYCVMALDQEQMKFTPDVLNEIKKALKEAHEIEGAFDPSPPADFY